jgi:lysozyme
MRKINQEGLALLKEFESLQLNAYDDGGGVWTIGWGHTGKDVYQGKRITEEEAIELLNRDLEVFEAAVDSLVKRKLTDNQFSALVMFVFNVGVNAFQKSTMLKLLNGPTPIKIISKEFSKWVYDNGRILKGLVRRREAEKILFLKSETLTT